MYNLGLRCFREAVAVDPFDELITRYHEFARCVFPHRVTHQRLAAQFTFRFVAHRVKIKKIVSYDRCDLLFSASIVVPFVS